MQLQDQLQKIALKLNFSPTTSNKTVVDPGFSNGGGRQPLDSPLQNYF